MKLSDRLSLVADFVEKGNRLADVGTDHGYVPIHLVQEGVIPYALACDINKGPLLRAQSHIAENNLQDKIETRLSNGLEKLCEGEVDSILIAGMGGALIRDILVRGENVYKSAKELILSPHSEVFLVREYLLSNGYEVVREEMVKDMGKYYVVMKCIKSDNIVKYSSCELIYGKLLLENRNSILYEYLLSEKGNFEKILQLLPENGKQDNIKRREEIINSLEIVDEALNYYDTKVKRS